MAISIIDLEAAVQQLPVSELTKFRKWFNQFDTAAWDEKIELDASLGKLDALADEALADFHAGKAREI